MSALPLGCLTRRDGVLNIAAHAAVDSNPPDLGPKGYFSDLSSDELGGNGSTRLHSAFLFFDCLLLCFSRGCSGFDGH